MQISFKNNTYHPAPSYQQPQHQDRKGPLTGLNNRLIDIAHGEKIGASITSGVLVGLSKIVARFEKVESLGDNKIINPAGKQGKELMKHLREKKYINNVPYSIILPAVATAVAVGLGLLKISTLYPKDEVR
ncbi:hypothetical protein tpqmel_0404 [Candidatus Gastranaerophilus sp. (ex Termes propinquus)]|nr:hypothetical protein tpqmel_0404 [Candidatus Gastranaerophilus sp. (ex Termes propinquus)]